MVTLGKNDSKESEGVMQPFCAEGETSDDANRYIVPHA